MSARANDPIPGSRRSRELVWLVGAFGVLLACTQIGSIVAPSLVKRSPELLLALSSRMRHLLFAVPAGINPVAYGAIGFVRLSLAAWVCYGLGRLYGDRGVAWLERQNNGELPASFRWLQRATDRAGALLVFLMPGSNIVCALVGQRRMRPGVFGACVSAGIAFRLVWLWIAAKAFESELKSALDFIERYQYWLVAAFFVITVGQGMFKAQRSPAGRPNLPAPPDERDD